VVVLQLPAWTAFSRSCGRPPTQGVAHGVSHTGLHTRGFTHTKCKVLTAPHLQAGGQPLPSCHVRPQPHVQLHQKPFAAVPAAATAAAAAAAALCPLEHDGRRRQARHLRKAAPQELPRLVGEGAGRSLQMRSRGLSSTLL